MNNIKLDIVGKCFYYHMPRCLFLGQRLFKVNLAQVQFKIPNLHFYLNNINSDILVHIKNM